MRPRISVVIPTYNSWSTLKECIRSILDQSLYPFEVIVIDNASTDNTSGNLKKIFPSIRLVELPENTGVTGGRNAGIKQISKKVNYILFFDHDMKADKKMLEELVKIAQLERGIGIVTPKVYYLSDKKRIWSAGTDINLWTGQVLFRGGKDIGQYEKDEEVQIAPAAMLVKKKVIERIKRFDDRYFATYEDTDFCFRARKEGFKTFYAPKAIAYHDLSTDKKDEAKRLLDRAYWIGRNRILFMKDFGENFFIFLVFLPIYLGYYLLMSIKFKRWSGGLNFLRGVLNGLST